MRFSRNLFVFLLLALVPISAVRAEVQTLIFEDFEDDADNARPPKNDGHPGTWQQDTEIKVLPKSKEVPSRAATYDNHDSFLRYNMYGYLKADQKVTTVGQSVHSEIGIRYGNGFIAFGITTDATATSPTDQAEKALVFFQFQHATDSYNKHLLVRDVTDELYDLGVVLHDRLDPWPNGTTFDKLAVDYTVGNATATLSLNDGKPITVPLRNPRGPVDGFFFIDASSRPISVTDYRIDNLLMTTEPLDPSKVFAPPAPAPSLPQVPPTSRDAVRFLTQATYGANPEAIDEVKAKGFDAWITDQIKTPATLTTPIVRHRKTMQTGDGINAMHFWNAWWQCSLTAPDQLRQRVAFALSQIFVISQDNLALEKKPYAISTYYDMLLNNAFGNYRDLLEQVTLSPAMGNYLNLRGSRKADGKVNPNENYAREILQLFSIGLNKLNPDGTLRLGSDGAPIPTYDQDVVVGFARALTGWNYHQSGTDPNPAPDFENPMTLIPDLHETDAMSGKKYSKLLLDGITLQPKRTGQQDLKDSLDVIFNHPNVGPFICRQLIQRLVCSNPSPGYVYRVASKFNNNGEGVRGDMSAVVRAILTDYEARSPDLLGNPGYGHLKEPVVRAAQVMRAFKPRSLTHHWTIGNTDAQLDQTPMRAKTVFNFFNPDYAKPGEMQSAMLVSPEFQITSEHTAIMASNFVRFGIENGFGSGADIRLNFAREEPLAADPSALLDHLDLLLMAGQMSPKMKATIKEHILTIPESQPRERVQAAVCLIAASPEYDVQR